MASDLDRAVERIGKAITVQAGHAHRADDVERTIPKRLEEASHAFAYLADRLAYLADLRRTGQ